MNLYLRSFLPYHLNSGQGRAGQGMLLPHFSHPTMELSLDLTLAFVPKPISFFFADAPGNDKVSTLEAFVNRLEDELRKVEAFQRELPLCMLLLNDAISRLKEEKVKCSGTKDPLVSEEFVPLKTNSGGNGNGNGNENENESCEMKNWMSSAQLWSTQETKSRNEEDESSVPEKPVNGNSSVLKKEGSKVPNFSLMTHASELSHSNSKSFCGDNSCGSSLLRVEVQSQPQPPQHMQQNPRKQRRCWSPELHRRFVDALQQLGGPQVATPKQIRELMQVEGLTNDEVKSHLQKYRLHVRRFPVSSIGQGNNNGSWMVQDQDQRDKSKGNLSQSGSPQGPLTPLLLGGSVKGLSSPGRNSVDAEDEQSDCRNWKGGIHQHLGADNQSL